MYVGRRYRSVGRTTLNTRYWCTSCSFESDIQVFGSGEGEGASPYFLDEAGAQQRATERAQQSADKDALRLLRLVACPRCGYRDPQAVSRERQQQIGVALAIISLWVVVALVCQSWVMAVVGIPLGYFSWTVYRNRKSRPEDCVVFVDENNSALPNGSGR
jgi:DNA-directed RNA polymerase subunit RPC12/RpoP